MRGTILVLETPYFVKTDTTGRYRARLPSGRQTLGLRSDDLKILVEGNIPARGISLAGESAEPAKRSPVIE